MGAVTRRSIIAAMGQGGAAEVIDYYISPTGNDTTGDGSLAHPLATLAHALTHVANGQKIGVLTGIYREAFGLSTSKTNLTIKAVSGAIPSFYGSVNFATWAKTGGQTNVYEAAYTSTTCYGVWDLGITRLTSTASVAVCDALPNSFYFDDAGDKLYVNIGGSAPTSVEASVSYGIFLTVTGTNFTIDRLNFAYHMQGIKIQADNSTIKNCNWTHHVGFGASESWSPIDIVSGTTHLIDRCTFVGDLAKWDKVLFVYVKSTATAATISNCTASVCTVPFMINGGTGHIIKYNIAHDYQMDMVGISAGSTIVRYNIAYDFSHSGYWVGTAGTMIAHHNIAYITKNVTPGPTSAVWGFVCDPGGSVEWYHNVAANLILATSSNPRCGFYINTTGTIVVKNNTSYNNRTGYSKAEATPSSWDADYNCANSNTNNYSTSPAWTPGAHDIVTDPTFTAPTTDDFTLQAGSPCIDAGVAIAGINDGFLGFAPDIGRYEKA